MHPPDANRPPVGEPGAESNALVGAGTPQGYHQPLARVTTNDPTTVRCDDCLNEAAEILIDAKWQQQAGVDTDVIVNSVALAGLWWQIAELHDERGGVMGADMLTATITQPTLFGADPWQPVSNIGWWLIGTRQLQPEPFIHRIRTTGNGSVATFCNVIGRPIEQVGPDDGHHQCPDCSESGNPSHGHREWRTTYRRSNIERGISRTFDNRAEADALVAEFPELPEIRVETRVTGQPWEVTT